MVKVFSVKSLCSAEHIAEDCEGKPTSNPGREARETTSLEVVEENHLIVQENLRDFLLELDFPVSKWMFSVPDLLQKD